MSCRLFGCTHVYFSSFLLHFLSELLLPIVLDLVQQTLHPLRLQGSEDVVDGQLRRLLAEVHVGAVPAGVFGVFLPRIVLRLPPVQFLQTENISQTQLKIFYLPTEITTDEVRLVFTSATIETRLRHLLGRAQTIFFERPQLERLNPGLYI